MKIELVNEKAGIYRTSYFAQGQYQILNMMMQAKLYIQKVKKQLLLKDATLPAGFTATVTDKDNATTTIQNVGVYTIAISDNARNLCKRL